MMMQFVTTLRRTVEDHVRVTVPDGIEVEQLYGNVYIKSPTQPNVSLQLQVAASKGLVSIEKL